MEEGVCKLPRRVNPRQKANSVSALFFLYMIPIFRRNYKKGLKEEHLFEPLAEHRAKILGDGLEDRWKKTFTKSKYSLHWALFRLHAFELTLYGILILINEICLVVVVPLAVGGFVSHFEDQTVNETQAYKYAALLIFGILLDAVLTHSTSMGLMHVSMKIAVACSSVIYRKSLRLCQNTLGQITVGHVINLLSNDVGNFQYQFLSIHYVWIAPIQAMLGSYLLYRTIGLASFSGISFLLLFIPLQIYFGKRKSKIRLRTAIRTDERVGLFNEILNGIQVIKMYTWEKPFAKLISSARRAEIKQIRIGSYLDAATFSLEKIIPGVATFLTIITYTSLGYSITAELMYSVMAIYDAIRPTMTIMFSEGISSMAEIHVSICRIRQFLSKHELELKEANEENPMLVLDRIKAHWNFEAESPVLDGISLEICKNQLIAVIGPVGSGKSSLLNVILNELTILEGAKITRGRISYASQESWLFSASVRKNILFTNDYDHDRYRTVFKACGLQCDLEGFQSTIVGEKGKVLSGGQKARVNLARALYKRADIYLLDDPLSAVDAQVGRQIFKECVLEFLKDKICILVTHQLHYAMKADRIIIIDEGKIIGQGTYENLLDSGLDFAQFLEKKEEEKESAKNDDNHLAKPEDDFLEPEISAETMQSGSIKLRVYNDYFAAGGNKIVFSLLILVFLLAHSVSTGNYYYISYWVNLEQANQTYDRNVVIITYSGITALTITLALIRSIFFFVFFTNASIKIHDSMFGKISSAPMTFFNLNPTGRILNRFSEDLGVIDEYLPGIFADVIEIALDFIGVIVVTSIINPWLLIPSCCLLVLFHLLRKVYLETSRSVKRIEGIVRSPIYGHMTATLQGIATIRAFGAQESLKTEFDDLQDLHSSAWFMFIASSRAFAFWLDLISAIFVSLIIISLLIFNKNYYGGDVGLILTQYLGMTGILQWGMHQWSELENNMTSVERILEYKDLQSEEVRESVNKPKNWPEHGEIIFQNLTMRYRECEAPVLKNLDLAIKEREKIGVVGRTGAGKSSTISALFQLYPLEGSILIDQIDCTKLPLEEVRSKLSIIPQDPVLFSGTVRTNLDPFEEFDDETLGHALEQVELKEALVSLSARVSENGSNFSVGQRQLLCLARAIVRRNKILVMDEATANVDLYTDALIQQTIRKRFIDCTVLTVAHRLNTIMDSDRVLVMDAGKIVEFDHPYKLLQNRGAFYAMVESSGRMTYQNLYTMAEKSFLKLDIT